MTVEVTPEEHDQQIAKSQAVFPFDCSGDEAAEMGFTGHLHTRARAFDRLVRTVQQDTDQLFLDIERENPYAAEWRQRFIQEVLSLDKETLRRSGEPLFV